MRCTKATKLSSKGEQGFGRTEYPEAKSSFIGYGMSIHSIATELERPLGFVRQQDSTRCTGKDLELPAECLVCDLH
jgi:hypothetical protein